MKKIFALLLCYGLASSSILSASQIEILAQEIKEKQENFPIGDFADSEYVKKTIDYMYELDQKARFSLIKEQSNLEARALIKQMDEFHTDKMKKILSKHQWVMISKFDAEYDRKAWLLTQHADNDPRFQYECLAVLSTLINNNETDKKNYAYLHDRVALKFKEFDFKQRYGTQITIAENGEVALSPYEGAIEDVEKRRKEIGLEPLNQYLEKVKEMYKK